MKQIIFTNFTPIKVINLGLLVLEKNKRISVPLDHGKIYHDTLLVHIDLPEKEGQELIRDWIVFHEFLMDSQYSIYYYDFAQFSQNLKIIGDCAYLTNYNELAEKIYFPNKVNGEILNYKILFGQYSNLSPEQKCVIRNFLIKLDNKHSQPINPILNIQYWQLMVYYSTIEYVIGKQKSCSQIHKCEIKTCKFFECGIQHHQKNYIQYIEDYLTPRIINKDIRKQYLDCIRNVYTEVRNDIVHRGAMSEAIYVCPKPNSTEIYGLTRATAEYAKDSTALMSLILMARDIARNLLLDKFFNTRVFPELKALKLLRIP